MKRGPRRDRASAAAAAGADAAAGSAADSSVPAPSQAAPAVVAPTPAPAAAAAAAAARAPLPFAANEHGLDARLLRAVARAGWAAPTAAQAAALPPLLSGRDAIVRARTGGGKTGAFALALLQRLLTLDIGGGAGAGAGAGAASPAPRLRAVVLVPTRELAEQTAAVLRALASGCGLVVAVAGGGAGAAGAGPAVDGGARVLADILVGTAARVLATVPARARAGALSAVRMLVLDEADLLLSYGYADDVKAVVAALPRAACQVVLLSATLPAGLDELRRVALHDAVLVDDAAVAAAAAASGAGGAVAGASAPPAAAYYVRVGTADRYLLLYALLKLRLLAGKALIFVATVDTAYRLKLFLERFSVAAAVLNAELPANSRAHTLAAYNRGVFDLLVTTDAGAGASAGMGGGGDGAFDLSRGIDFAGVTAVVNFDAPADAGAYAHRIGRTARGGAGGVALTFLAPAGTRPAHDGLLAELAQAAAPPTPLPFAVGEVEGFRYRVEDVLRGVSAGAVRAVRAAELRRELAASAALRAHFEDNPRDAAALRAGVVRAAPPKPHLRDVPAYLLPAALRAAAEEAGGGVGAPPRKRARSRAGGNKGGGGAAAAGAGAKAMAMPSRTADPLRAFAYTTKRRRVA